MRVCIALFLAVLFLAAGSSPGGPRPELRGIWVHGTQIQTPAAADAIVARINRANLNAASVLVWYWGGQAFFRNSLCPMAEGVQEGYDPLGYMVQQCHQRSIQVHAWFVNGAYGAQQPRHVLDKHPDWAVQDGSGSLWYDFSRPEVRRFESDLMIECLRRYDVDGLQFDYIRYGPQQCYCDYCQETFARRYGFEPLTRQRRLEFPTGVSIAANPLARPTTATILAEFCDRTPAIALNKLGQGTVLLLNWHAENEMPPAVAETVKLTLGIWTTGGGPLHLTTTAATRAEYGNNALETTRVCLTRLGFVPTSIPAENIDRLSDRAVLVLPAVYILPQAVASDLERFVRKGGHLLIIDGPVKSMQLPAMQRITGFAGTGPYLRRDDVIRSAGRSPLVPRGKHQMNLWDWKRRMNKWAEFRKLGVTELVRDVYRRAKGLKPNVQVTASVFSTPESAEAAYQEWPRWLREKTIDYVIPMAYTEDTANLAGQIDQWKKLDSSLQRIIPGLSIYQDVAGKAAPRDMSLIRRQQTLCRTEGANGTMYFSMEYLTEPLIGVFRKEFYPREAPVYAPPRRSP
jgi:uncharacterized lipoprotein YddW (UPF0748 family)